MSAMMGSERSSFSKEAKKGSMGLFERSQFIGTVFYTFFLRLFCMAFSHETTLFSLIFL